MTTPALSAKKKPHPFQSHPACGRLRHEFTRTAPRDGATARIIDPKMDHCAKCGNDEAAHALTTADYLGPIDGLERFLEVANPETIDVEAPIVTVAGAAAGAPALPALEDVRREIARVAESQLEDARARLAEGIAEEVEQMRLELAASTSSLVDDRLGPILERITRLEAAAKAKS